MISIGSAVMTSVVASAIAFSVTMHYNIRDRASKIEVQMAELTERIAGAKAQVDQLDEAQGRLVDFITHLDGQITKLSDDIADHESLPHPYHSDGRQR